MLSSMNRILVLLAALMSLAFVVTTPESRKELERARRTWHRDVATRWDKQALHAFLVRTLPAIKKVEGVSIEPIDAGQRFVPARDRFYWQAGHWLFVTKNPKQDAFELRTSHRELGWIILVCEREGRRTFRLTEAKADPSVMLCPPPWTFEP